MRGLYIHIPFCVKKCSYCDFYSLPGRMDSMEAYVQALLREAAHYREMSFETLYIGGGTPSLLGAKHLKTLIEGLKKTFNIKCHCEESRGNRDDVAISGGGTPTSCHCEERNDAAISGGGTDEVVLTEATIEMNPESATKEFLEAAKETGFNRLSIGVQSLADDELRSVGRIHTAEQALAAISLAKKVGFEAVSADLIIGLPGQTWTSLRNSMDALIKLGVRHISAYCLSLEEGTVLRDKPPDDLPDDEMQAKLYEETRKFLNIHGFLHYEISNFASKGYECRHNLNYWRGGEYLGLGAAAASHLGGMRWRNRADLDAYIQSPTGQIEEIETLGIEDKAAEEAMLRLRLVEEGIDIVELADRYEWDSIEGLVRRLEEMAGEGLLVREGIERTGYVRPDKIETQYAIGVRYKLAPESILTSNRIFERVISK